MHWLNIQIGQKLYYPKPDNQKVEKRRSLLVVLRYQYRRYDQSQVETTIASLTHNSANIYSYALQVVRDPYWSCSRLHSERTLSESRTKKYGTKPRILAKSWQKSWQESVIRSWQEFTPRFLTRILTKILVKNLGRNSCQDSWQEFLPRSRQEFLKSTSRTTIKLPRILGSNSCQDFGKILGENNSSCQNLGVIPAEISLSFFGKIFQKNLARS